MADSYRSDYLASARAVSLPPPHHVSRAIAEAQGHQYGLSRDAYLRRVRELEAARKERDR